MAQKELMKITTPEGNPVQAESAIRDGTGNVIANTYSTATRLTNGSDTDVSSIEHGYSYAAGKMSVGLAGGRAYGPRSVAMGAADAEGQLSVAEGQFSRAEAWGTHAAGNATIAGSGYQFVVGQVNDNSPDNVFEVGNGTATFEEITPRPTYQQALENHYFLAYSGGGYQEINPKLIDEDKYNNQYNKTYQMVRNSSNAFIAAWDGHAEVQSIKEVKNSVINYGFLNSWLNLAYEYDNTKTYAKGETCFYSNCLFRCIATNGITTPEDWDSTHWELLIAGYGSRTFALGERCFYQGKLYQCISVISSPEDWTPAHWKLCVAEGENAVQQLPGDHGIGYDNPYYTPSYTFYVGAVGKDSFEANGNSMAYGRHSSAFGRCSLAEGQNSFALGNKCVAKGNNSLAGGTQSYAEGANGAFAYGNNCRATGSASHAVNNNNLASGVCSFAEGNENTASGAQAHACGLTTTASATNSFAGGKGSKTTSVTVPAGTFPEDPTRTKTEGSFAFGKNAWSRGDYSVVFGYETKNDGGANSYHLRGVLIAGQYNASNGHALLEIGNGTSNSDRKNALTVFEDGTATIGAMGNNNLSIATKKYVDDGVAGKEDASNKVTSIVSTATDTEYPSAKAVYDALSSAVSSGIAGFSYVNFNSASNSGTLTQTEFNEYKQDGLILIRGNDYYYKNSSRTIPNVSFVYECVTVGIDRKVTSKKITFTYNALSSTYGWSYVEKELYALEIHEAATTATLSDLGLTATYGGGSLPNFGYGRIIYVDSATQISYTVSCQLNEADNNKLDIEIEALSTSKRWAKTITVDSNTGSTTIGSLMVDANRADYAPSMYLHSFVLTLTSDNTKTFTFKLISTDQTAATSIAEIAALFNGTSSNGYPVGNGFDGNVTGAWTHQPVICFDGTGASLVSTSGTSVSNHYVALSNYTFTSDTVTRL